MGKQRGFLMMMAAVILVIIAALGMALVKMFQSGVNSSSSTVAYSDAFNLAQAGIEAGANQLVSSTSWCTGAFQSTVSVSGVGEYRYRCLATNTTASLSADINNTATTIPLSSVANFADFGAITIGSEQIYYQGRDSAANTLLNAKRGQNGSVAATFARGVSVTQNQYIIESEAANPSLSGNVWGKSVLQEAFLLQQGAVYYAGGNDGNLFEYNGSTWVNRVSGGANLMSVVIPPVLNSTNGYAAGAALTFLLKSSSGVNWSSQTVSGISPTTSISINGLAFYSNTLGHAVAYDDTNRIAYAYSIDMGSGVWIPRTLSATTRYNFRSVSCADANNCWAVGYRVNSSGTSYTTFYARWTGIFWSITRQTSNTYSSFNNISIDCPLANRCMVVFDAGRYYYYNGSWPSGPSQLSFASAQNFNSVSCPDSNTCMIVGSGGRWVKCTLSNSSASCPNPNNTIPGSPDLRAVHCISGNDCMAVGVGTIAYRYNGSTWTATSAINGSNSYILNAVSGPITTVGGVTKATPTVWQMP